MNPLIAPMAAVGIVFAVSHALLRRLSRQPFTRRDWAQVVYGSFGVDALDSKRAVMVAAAAIVLVPGVVSAVMAGWTWKSWWPVGGLLAATAVGVWMAMPPNPWRWHVPAVIAWNTLYMLSCIPPIQDARLRIRWHAQEACTRCGYPQEGLPGISPCPECGRTDDGSHTQQAL